MGMDLYSKRGDEYYRFNWGGWRNVCEFLDGIGCDLREFSGFNDGDIVPPKSCQAIATRLDEIKTYLTALIKCPADILPTRMGDRLKIFIRDIDIPLQIIERRLKGEVLSTKLLTDDDAGNEWGSLAYYLGFGKFCAKCAKLGGFRQC